MSDTERALVKLISGEEIIAEIGIDHESGYLKVKKPCLITNANVETSFDEPVLVPWIRFAGPFTDIWHLIDMTNVLMIFHEHELPDEVIVRYNYYLSLLER